MTVIKVKPHKELCPDGAVLKASPGETLAEALLDNDIKTLILTDPDNWPLPPFSAGSHIDVYLPSGKIRQYSLCGDPDIADNRYFPQ